MVIELVVPPRRQREQIIHAACGDLPDPGVAARIADAEQPTPAVAARAAAVVRCIHTELPANEVSLALAHLVSNTLAAQGHGRLRMEDADTAVKHYGPAFVRCATDLLAMADGLHQRRATRLCIHGPLAQEGPRLDAGLDADPT